MSSSRKIAFVDDPQQGTGWLILKNINSYRTSGVDWIEGVCIRSTMEKVSPNERWAFRVETSTYAVKLYPNIEKLTEDHLDKML